MLYPESAVMLATFNIHQSMGRKVDREVVATLVLPQPWTVHVGFPLNIRKLPLILLRSAKYQSVYTLMCLMHILVPLLTLS